MISAFYVAVALKRVFLIKHEHPFQLNLALKPKHINWTFEDVELPAYMVEKTINMVDATREENINEILLAHAANIDVLYACEPILSRDVYMAEISISASARFVWLHA